MKSVVLIKSVVLNGSVSVLVNELTVVNVLKLKIVVESIVVTG